MVGALQSGRVSEPIGWAGLRFIRALKKVLGKGVEPLLLSEPDPKSGASASSATRAQRNANLTCGPGRRQFWRVVAGVSRALASGRSLFKVFAVKICIPLMALLLSGCSVLQQLDEWSRPKIRYVDPRDIGPDGLPNAQRAGFVNKFILASEIPVEEFYPGQWYSSNR
jgi:hypothetical protein